MATSTQVEYDIFVSYRSDDIHLVRPVAEDLMAEGTRVWFAEYEVLLSGRECFDSAIRRGVSNCSFGLCFTNDNYARSEHCRNEVRLLLERLGPGRIVEIRCPHQPMTHAEFPELRNSFSFDYVGPDQVLRDIQSVIGCSLDLSSTASEAQVEWHDFSYEGIRFRLDLGGWRVRRPFLRWIGGGDRRVLTYSRSWKSETLRGNLIVGPMDFARGTLRFPDNSDDRAYYDRALKFADSFFEAHVHQAPIGVHLSFVPGHISQGAFTTQFAPGVIERLYSVTLPPLPGRRDLELAFFFFFHGAARDFFRRAHLMDRVVHSLSLESRSTAIGRILTLGRSMFSVFRKRRAQLGHAVLSGDISRVRELLERGVNPNERTLLARGPQGRTSLGTPLIAAASEGLIEMVAELLAHGAYVDGTNTRGRTALSFAAEGGYEAICSLLLDSGADPNFRDVVSELLK